MRENKKKIRKHLAVLILGLVVGGINFQGAALQTQASEQKKEQVSSAFQIEAQILPSDTDTYNIGLTVGNQGADWEGTVRVKIDEGYCVPSAYDTALTLPQGSEKTFTVEIPKAITESSNGTVTVLLLDEKSKKVTGKTFRRFLTDEMENLVMGILSDDYSALTYLDMGGEAMYYYSGTFPIKLLELNQDNLQDSLDVLTILVIDKYNTSVLTDEEKKAIALWVDGGGTLIVGTGEYANDTLGGIVDSIPEVECKSIVKPGTQGDLDIYGDRSVDIAQLTLADLNPGKNLYESSYWGRGFMASVGDGAVGVFPYSFVELGQAADTIYDGTTQENYVMSVLDEVTCMTNSRYNRTNATASVYEAMNLIRRMMGIMGKSNTSLNFGVLKLLVVLYVIFAGPVLYLILRFTKKREWYWLAVPCASLLGIIVIFFAGRGFEVESTRVYSVTTQDMSNKQDMKSYLYCFDANFKEWDLKLNGDYEYAGALMNDEYGYDDKDELAYYHHIKREGEDLLFGIKPSSAFEDSYFYAGKKAGSSSATGSIEFAGVADDWRGLRGTISNHTDKDFRYLAVIVEDNLYVYEGVGAGEQCSLAQQTPIYDSGRGYNIWSDYIYDFLDNYYDEKTSEEMGALAALGTGICTAYPQSNDKAVVVCGVVENWEKTVDDNCSEMSYGCLYTVQ